ncbi:MAG: aspartate--ammonia ligase [Bacilli bacterium]
MTSTKLLQTQIQIKEIKDFFQINLANNLNLVRVSAPLYVVEETGLNDNLNGIEEPVSFKACGYDNIQIVHSLAKWKRQALYKYNIGSGNGLYTDMNAIRKDETVSNIHSLYVDQWDWEKNITSDQRCDEYLEETVKKIYSTIYKTEQFINEKNHSLSEKLPEEIFFITSQELLELYPTFTPKQREYEITKKHKAVFIKHIGKTLTDGTVHDNRAPDYDDWELNGDILVYHHPLDIALELSSMGIRVDEKRLVEQLKHLNQEYKLDMPYHKSIINKELPYTIGGGIGQSRLCMFFLEKHHIGEVQCSVWPNSIISECEKNNIILL